MQVHGLPAGPNRNGRSPSGGYTVNYPREKSIWVSLGGAASGIAEFTLQKTCGSSCCYNRDDDSVSAAGSCRIGLLYLSVAECPPPRTGKVLPSAALRLTMSDLGRSRWRGTGRTDCVGRRTRLKSVLTFGVLGC